MTTSPAVQATEGRKIGRPLKVLIPMIQSELQQGNDAGHDHYRRAGEMLIEAKDQIPHGRWGKWLTKNFNLSDRTAQGYMRWAREEQKRGGAAYMPSSMREFDGHTERSRERSKQHQEFRRILRDATQDDFIRDIKNQNDMINAYRKIAMSVVEAGYKVVAMEAHPDKGGSKEKMAMLNRVVGVLRQFVKTRRSYE